MEPTTQEVKKKVKVITLGVVAALAAFLSIAFLFWWITDEIVIEKETKFDLTVFNFLSRYTNPVITKILLVCTFFGSRNFLLPAYTLLCAFFMFYKRKRFYSISIAAVGIGTMLLLNFIKNTFQRHRPLEPLIPDVTGFSYPSGHSFSSFTFFGILTYIIWHTKLSNVWKWILSILFIGLAIIIAISRVYLHVHFASDVLAGFCLSAMWLAICYLVLNKLVKSKTRNQ